MGDGRIGSVFFLALLVVPCLAAGQEPDVSAVESEALPKYAPLEVVRAVTRIVVEEAPLYLQLDEPSTYVDVEAVIRNRSEYRIASWRAFGRLDDGDDEVVDRLRYKGEAVAPGEELTIRARYLLSTEQGVIPCVGVDGLSTCSATIESFRWLWAEALPPPSPGDDAPEVLTPTIIELALGNNACIKQCLARQQVLGYLLAGKTWVRFEVHADGPIHDLTILTSIDARRDLEECMMGCLEDTFFSPLAGWVPKTVKYPFVIGGG